MGMILRVLRRQGTQPLLWLWCGMLFLLPLISGMGSVITVAGLAPVRPFAVLLVLVALGVAWHRGTAPAPVSWGIMILGALWLGWGLFHPVSSPAISELASIVLGLATTWALVLRPASNIDLKWFTGGWIFAWWVSVLPAAYEIVTGTHLPNYLESSPQWVRESSTDAASFFVNPNPFAYFLAVGMVMLAIAATMSSRTWIRRCIMAMVLLTPVVVYFSGSRITTLVCCLILLWAVWAWWPGLVRRIIVISGMVAVAALAVAFAMVPVLSAKVQTALSGSGVHRLNLYRSGVWMLGETLGLGVGAGNFEGVIALDHPYDTADALNPHSGVVEIASQYGVLWAGVLLAALLVLMWVGGRGFLQRFQSRSEEIMRQAVFVSALALPLLSFADSAFLDSPIAWVHVAGTAMVACSLRLQDSSVLTRPQRVPVAQVLGPRQRLRQAIARGARAS